MFSPYAAMGNAPESMVDPNGTTFTVSGDLDAAKGILDKWLGAGNYRLDDGTVSINEGKQEAALSHLTKYFMDNNIGGGSGAVANATAQIAANWVMSMIGDVNRNINMNVLNNGHIALEGNQIPGHEFANGFESYESDIYTSIEKGLNGRNSNSNMMWDFAYNSRQAVKWGLYIPQAALLFSSKTAWGRTLSGAGSKLTLSEFKLTKSFSGALTRIGWGLGVVNAGLIYHQYDKGEIGKLQFASEEVSNGLTQVPMLGWAWGVGWEMGRGLTGSNWYKSNLRPTIWGGLDFIFNRNTPLD